jgi:hypothetical protein
MPEKKEGNSSTSKAIKLPYDIYSVGYPIKPNKKKHT